MVFDAPDQPAKLMELRFWGVRGSIPSPGRHTVAAGGNTTCVSVRHGDLVLVFDAGTGIRLLGNYLEGEDERSRWKGSIFFSHYHWDHIQGLPFFRPAFREENRFHLYGERKGGLDVERVLRHQMQAPFFPVPLDAQDALVTFNPLAPGSVLEPRGGVVVRTVRLQHPGGAIGYRLESPRGSICIVTDHEHPPDDLDREVVTFARGATILIHDAQYTPEEKRGPKAGWGHSSWEEAARTARAAAVGRLYLSHHDPDRSDRELSDILVQARDVFPETELAVEGVSVGLG